MIITVAFASRELCSRSLCTTVPFDPDRSLSRASREEALSRCVARRCDDIHVEAEHVKQLDHLSCALLVVGGVEQTIEL